MRLLSMLFIGTNAMYRNELRHLPEKLRQERIQQTVLLTFQRLQTLVIQTASLNRTDLQFSLYCLEPNIVQSVWTSLYQPYGVKYILSPLKAMRELVYPILPRPRCENKYGYELYQKWNDYARYLYIQSQDEEKMKRYNQMMENHYPGTPLEDSPLVYIQRFFELFNRVFPDIHLEVSSYRPSQGIFDQECCPIYNVSW